MLKVNVEGIVINILITDDGIYFEDGAGKYRSTPCNRYAIGTDSYEISEKYLWDDSYLNFGVDDEVESFKDYCIAQYKNDIYSFKYHELSVVMEYMEDAAINIRE